MEKGKVYQKCFRLSIGKPQDRYLQEKLAQLPAATQTAVIKQALVEYFQKEEQQPIITQMAASMDHMQVLEQRLQQIIADLQSL